MSVLNRRLAIRILDTEPAHHVSQTDRGIEAENDPNAERSLEMLSHFLCQILMSTCEMIPQPPRHETETYFWRFHCDYQWELFSHDERRRQTFKKACFATRHVVPTFPNFFSDNAQKGAITSISTHSLPRS